MAEFTPISTTIANGLVLNGWSVNQGHREVIFFAHGNGFCTRAYEPMLAMLSEYYDLLMYDLPGHGQSPGSEFVGFNQTGEHLHQAVLQSQEMIAGRNMHVVAHSLGGMATMLAASKHPDTFKSMVLLDPIMFPKNMLIGMRLISRFKLTSYLHPFVKPTLRRRNGWSDKKEAFKYFHKRKIFKYWTDEALEGYVEHALKESSDPTKSAGVVLCCDPELEAQWFGSVPSKPWQAVADLAIPVSIFMGQSSYPFSLRAGEYAARVNRNIVCSVVPGSHCFMQEYPGEATGYVVGVLG